MSQQVTATVADDIDDWLETISDELGVSKSKAQSRCFRAVRDHDNPREVLQPYSESSVDASTYREDIRALRERVDALEDMVGDASETDGSQRAAASALGDDSINGDWVSEHGDWSVAESAETDAKNDALADAYQRIKSAGELSSSDIVDVHDDHDLGVAKSTWRREVLGVLGSLPGIKPPARGESTWQYVDENR